MVIKSSQINKYIAPASFHVFDKMNPRIVVRLTHKAKNEYISNGIHSADAPYEVVYLQMFPNKNIAGEVYGKVYGHRTTPKFIESFFR